MLGICSPNRLFTGLFPRMVHLVLQLRKQMNNCFSKAKKNMKKRSLKIFNDHNGRISLVENKHVTGVQPFSASSGYF